MDRFIEFEKTVSFEDLKRALSVKNPGILILRHSKLTGAFKVRSESNLNNRDLKRAFQPYKIKRIYADFPLKTTK